MPCVYCVKYRVSFFIEVLLPVRVVWERLRVLNIEIYFSVGGFSNLAGPKTAFQKGATPIRVVLSHEALLAL